MTLSGHVVRWNYWQRLLDVGWLQLAPPSVLRHFTLDRLAPEMVAPPAPPSVLRHFKTEWWRHCLLYLISTVVLPGGHAFALRPSWVCVWVWGGMSEGVAPPQVCWGGELLWHNAAPQDARARFLDGVGAKLLHSVPWQSRGGNSVISTQVN